MNKAHKTFLVNILHKDGHWSDHVSIGGRSYNEAVKRLLALRRRLHLEPPVAIVEVAK